MVVVLALSLPLVTTQVTLTSPPCDAAKPMAAQNVPPRSVTHLLSVSRRCYAILAAHLCHFVACEHDNLRQGSARTRSCDIQDKRFAEHGQNKVSN